VLAAECGEQLQNFFRLRRMARAGPVDQ
jgi:hypothetical protein